MLERYENQTEEAAAAEHEAALSRPRPGRAAMAYTSGMTRAEIERTALELPAEDRRELAGHVRPLKRGSPVFLPRLPPGLRVVRRLKRGAGRPRRRARASAPPPHPLQSTEEDHPMRHAFTLEYWLDEGWYVGRLREMPGVFSQGQTLEQLEENIRDAYDLVLADEAPAAIPAEAQRKPIEVEV
jgi:predicted RNase H-like HicB family nuclease